MRATGRHAVRLPLAAHKIAILKTPRNGGSEPPAVDLR
jgi:hypothetical protein